MKLVLFDIDGTLLLSGGAGLRALNRALLEIYGIEAGMDSVPVHGRTDPLILREALARSGIEDGDGALTMRLYRLYVRFLERELEDASDFRVLQGVRPVLDELAGDSSLKLGIATGNVEEGAFLKLRRAGLQGYFHFGGYGSDSEDRTELIRTAVLRGGELVSPQQVAGVVVIGDTPLDVLHGKRAGARVVAVASGTFGREELAESGADLVLPSLESSAELRRFLSES